MRCSLNMRMLSDRCLVLVVAALLAAAPAAADGVANLEFVDASLADILVALGAASGRSVVPDASVEGRASYYVHDVRFEEALRGFARRFDLFVEQADGVFLVSALRVVADEAGLVSVEAPRVRPQIIVDRLARATRTSISADGLPRDPIAFYSEARPLADVLASLVASLPAHRLESASGGWRIVRLGTDSPAASAAMSVRVHEGRYSLDAPSTTLAGLLSELFDASGASYQLLAPGGTPVGPMRHVDRSFEQTLTLITEQADATWRRVGDVYYVVSADPGSAASRALVTSVVALEHLSVTTLLELLPSDRTVSVAVRGERSRNELTITGAPTDVERIEALVARLDVPPRGRSYRRYDLRTITPAQLGTLLPAHLHAIELVELPGTRAVVALATDQQTVALERLLDAIDRPPAAVPVTLDHVTVAQLLEALPPSARPGDVVPTGDPQRFFHLGTGTERERFLEELAAIDTPVPAVRYHLLVIQYQKGDGFDFDIDLSNTPTEPEAEQAFLARIGSLLMLDFDIVSTLGYQFAARLDASLRNASASIVADTTLNALSGRSVSFSNTNTYRYRDVERDPDSAETGSGGAIREITSGLVVEITGRAHGDAVTMDVSASVSRRGTDESATGTPPTTSEKVVRTRVRAPSGTPVILSGLRQQEDDRSIRETPLLARIPLLGLLFAARHETSDTTELAIYIVPQIERATDAPDADAALERIYGRFFGGSR
mgnify:FL=1